MKLAAVKSLIWQKLTVTDQCIHCSRLKTQILDANVLRLTFQVNLSVWTTKLSQIDSISIMTQLLSQDDSEKDFSVLSLTI